MANARSFAEYVKQRFDNELYNALDEYVQDNKENLDLDLYQVRTIDTIDVEESFTVKFVDVSDLPGTKIEFDVVIEAELSVHERDYHYDNTEECEQWFLLHCTGDLDCRLDDICIVSVCEYNGRNRNSKPLSDALVPIIKSENLEKEAELFLQRHYRKALLEPVWVDPKELAAGMNLTIRMANITNDGSVFGRCYFKDCDTELYNEEFDTMVVEKIPAGTILVDRKAYFMQTVGRSNNTIVHECVHWDLHKKAFLLAELYDSSLASVSCKVIGGDAKNDRDAVGWMEWQANALTPRIQMPLQMFKKKAESVISEFRREMHEYDLVEIIEPVIDRLATEYGVSRTAAKIRMVDAGYEEARGAFNYIDGSYVKPHKAKNGYLSSNRTFSIGAVDAAILSLTNNDLKEKLEKSRYQYVDSHFVLDSPVFLEYDSSGKVQLTSYARKHMDECCLVFELKVESHYGESYHYECYLNRDEHSTVDFSITFHNGYENSPSEKQLEILKEQIKEEYELYGILPNNYAQALRVIIDWKNKKIKDEKKKNPYSTKEIITEKEIAARAGISTKTVERTLNGDKTSINSLVLICLALHLPYSISSHIIKSSPVSFDLAKNDDHRMYDFCLKVHSGKTVDEVKDFLESVNAKPL